MHSEKNEKNGASIFFLSKSRNVEYRFFFTMSITIIGSSSFREREGGFMKCRFDARGYIMFVWLHRMECVHMSALAIVSCDCASLEFADHFNSPFSFLKALCWMFQKLLDLEYVITAPSALSFPKDARNFVVAGQTWNFCFWGRWEGVHSFLRAKLAETFLQIKLKTHRLNSYC